VWSHQTVKKFDDVCIQLDTIDNHKRDGQTDGIGITNSAAMLAHADAR